MSKNRLNLFMVLLSGLILVLLIKLTGGLKDLLHQIIQLDLHWLVLAFGCMFVNWLLEAKILHVITRLRYMKQHFFNSFKVTMVGQFFNSITPFASGGQPAQLYVLTRDGIEAGHAGSILMIKFIVFQGVLSIYSLVVILLRAAFFRERINHFFYFAIIGFLINITVILLAILLSGHERLTYKLMNFTLKLFYKIRVVKDMGKKEDSWKKQLKAFHENAALIKNNARLLITTSLLTVVQLTFFFAIPYCIYRSLGLVGASFFNILAAKAFVTMATSFIPLPGASGGAEGSFYLFFSLFFTPKTIILAILLWRIITYYSNIGLGGLITTLTIKQSPDYLRV